MAKSHAFAPWVATGLAALLAWAWVGAGRELPLGLDFCPMRRFFDLPCPGCGMTRALIALARGEWGVMWAFHPLAPLVAAEVGAAWLLCGLWAAGRARLPSAAAINFLLAANAALLVALWVGRFAAGALPW